MNSRAKFLRQRRRADRLELDLIELAERLEAAEMALNRIMESRTSMTVIGVDVSSRGSVAFATAGAGAGAGGRWLPTDDERRAR